MNQDNALIVFEDKRIRRIWHNDGWCFSVIDIIQALTNSTNPRNYWNMLKKRELEHEVELYTFCVQLKLQSSDGKYYTTDCANTESIFRIIQSIPSKRAEPFKRWLAKVGYERVQEIEDPELAQDRVKEYYELKEYPKEWIDKRLRGIAIRQELTDEWQNRGVRERKDFAILTNEISKATFEIGIKQHKELKNIPSKSKANLRDHMNDLELIFTMLGEKATTEITQTHDSTKFKQLKKDSRKGGSIARNARIELEKETGRKVVSDKNNFDLTHKRQKKLNKKD